MDTKGTRARAAGILAAGTAAAMALSACTGDPTPPTPSHHDPVTIRVAYWGDTGIFDDEAGPSLEERYEGMRPWVDIVPVPMDHSTYYDQLRDSLDAGEGTPNVVIIDEDFIAEAVGRADDFLNLGNFGAWRYQDDYLAWKWDQAANADGSVVIGLGADVGGLALCYRRDLFEAAGLPSDRDDVSAALGGSWDDFIAYGEEYFAVTGKKFIDNSTNVLNPAITQLGTGHSYFTRDDQLDLDNVVPAWNTAVRVLEAGLSFYYWLDHQSQNEADWNTALANGDFAVVLCSSSTLGDIESRVPADFEGQWDIADIPGPGGNSGGSFYTIPKQGTAFEQLETYRFVEWLIQPEQQITIMDKTGRLPSQTAILESDEVDSLTSEFFNDAPYGEIFATTVLDIPGPVYHSRCETDVRVAVESILDELQLGNVPSGDVWNATVAAAEAADECSDG